MQKGWLEATKNLYNKDFSNLSQSNSNCHTVLSVEIRICLLYPLMWGNTHQKGCFGYGIQLHLMMRVQFWKFWGVWSTLLLLLLPGQLRPKEIVLVRVSSMGRINLLKNLPSIGPCAKTKLRNNYAKTVIINIE